MQLKIDQSIIDKYPTVVLGILLAKNITVKNQNDELEQLKIKAVGEFLQKYNIQSLAEHPYIIAWKDQYASFGVKKKKRQAAAETLLRNVILKSDLIQVNTLVDICNLACVESILPIGVYDLNNINKNLYLRYSKEGDEFVPIGGKFAERVRPNEIIYSDEIRVLTRRWSQRDSEFVKVTSATKNAYLSVEGAEQIPREIISATTNKLVNYIKKFCGSEVELHIGTLSELNDLRLK